MLSTKKIEMYKLLLNRYIGSIALIIAIIGGGWYAAHKWHYWPAEAQQELINILGTTVNNLEVNLTRCRDDKTVIEFESFFEGGGDIETDNNADDNIFLKRMP